MSRTFAYAYGTHLVGAHADTLLRTSVWDLHPAYTDTENRPRTVTFTDGQGREFRGHHT